MPNRLREGSTLRRTKRFQAKALDVKSRKRHYGTNKLFDDRITPENLGPRVTQKKAQDRITPKGLGPRQAQVDKPQRTSKIPEESSEANVSTQKAPASGKLAHTPENPTQRGSVTSGADKATTNFISGTQAVNQAKTLAEKTKLERQLWSIGGSQR